MPRELAQSPPRAARLLARVPVAWRPALAWLGVGALLAIIGFGEDWSAMASQWWNSSTYNHVLLVPAIIGWLVWQRWPELSRLTPRAWWPPLIVAGGAAFLWVLGAFSGLNVARQFGADALLIAAVVTMLGPRASAALAFPIGYALLLVPLGDELVPHLQMVTAAITIALVHASGIQATIEGVFIHTPAGLFEVAEACSGIKFLIAMIAFGILVANLCFRSWPRRAAFMAVCVIVPILANGVRAWGTVYAAQWVGAEAASGFDHIVYGWIFFALVIAAVLALAWRFFDRSVDDSPIDLAAIERSPVLARLERHAIHPAAALMVLGGLVLFARVWAWEADAMRATLPAQIDLPAVHGWSRAPYSPTVWWQPRANGADHRLLGSYVDGAGRRVDVSVALYAAQDEGREAGGFGEGALMPGGVWRWQAPAPPLGDAAADRLLARGTVSRLAYTWYRSGDLLTGSNARLKLANIADRLRLRPDATASLIVSAEDSKSAPAYPAIAAFVRDTGDLGAWIDRTTGMR